MILSMVGGSLEAERANGTSRTNSDGNLNINCGFMPDLIILYLGSYDTGLGMVESTISIPFKEKKQTNHKLGSAVFLPDYILTGTSQSVSSAGATITMIAIIDETGVVPYANKNVTWRAVKYTD